MIDTRLLKSILSLTAVAVVGGGATYAAFTTNAVTIANNSVTAGSANLKICNKVDTNNWRTSITPNLKVANLTPGAAATELTNSDSSATAIFIGNDGGSLTTNSISGCASYSDPAGSSDITLKLQPEITTGTLVCDSGAPTLKDNLQLQFKFYDQAGTLVDSSTTRTLADWVANTTNYGTNFAPNDIQQIKLFASLKSTATAQDANCTFEVKFTGEQI